ncbi:uncharacterized protein LOC118645132 [Monomorium pharaonis]|uniref:uncharacterized protein LOC118645132 n=1 Tax=Monomorium pharaonis TaxID=307658 RepID=UPI00174698D8|nr:uncharacterized protein LOC118645132 [Monomorium pharaonis]
MDQQSYLGINEVEQEVNEVLLDELAINPPQETSNGRAATPMKSATETQQVEKPNTNSSAVELQKSDNPSQEDKRVIEDLDEDILEAIGSRVAEERVLAPAIPNSIAVRIEGILKKGLPKEEREKLLEAHVPPKNCVLTDPPKLNDEVKVSINETSKKQDDRIVEKQKKITACLALLGSSIRDIIDKNKTEGNPKLSTTQIELVKKLSEAARLLADLQRDETQTRRSLILAALSSSQKETLESGEADEWLFGQKLGDRLKAAKSIERSGKELKTKSKGTEKSKNSKTPSRRQSFKSRTSGGYQKGGYNRNQGKNWTRKRTRKNFRTQTPTEQKKT